MGAYEFNHIPIADAGPDQTCYAWIDGDANVYLNGNASSDMDGQPLTYTWYLDDQQIAAGSEPNVLLAAGAYEIKLIVSDGIDISEPDTVTIHVVGPIEVRVKLLPSTFNLKSNRKQIVGWMDMAGIETELLTAQNPIELLPADIDTFRQHLVFEESEQAYKLLGFWNTFRETIEGDGIYEATLVTTLASGRFVYGSCSMTINN
jgi:hypothetical protein